MASIAEFENILERCRVVRADQQKAAEELQLVRDSDPKRELAAKLAESIAIATESEKLAREALNREREVELKPREAWRGRSSR